MKNVALVPLAACLGLSLSGCAAFQAVEKAQDFDATRSQVDSLSTTSTMPTTGSATYKGEAALGADFGNDNYVLFGDTTIKANFTGAGGTMNGKMNNFTSVKLSDEQVAAYEDGNLNTVAVALSARNLSGSVDMTGGVITGNTFTMNTDGELSGNGQTFDVAGAIDGKFKGTGAEALEAGDAASFTIKRNGTLADVSDMELYATQ